MSNIFRLIVDAHGDEESLSTDGNILFINCPFKKSVKIFSFPRWRYSKRKFAKLVGKYHISCIKWFEYSLLNVFLYLLLRNMEKYDVVCFGLAGFDFSSIAYVRDVLAELDAAINDKKILVVIKQNSFEEQEIFSRFSINH